MVTVERRSPAPTEFAYQFFEFMLRLPEAWQLSWETLCELGDLNEPLQGERVEDRTILAHALSPAEHGWIATQLRTALLHREQAADWSSFGPAFGYELPDSSLFAPGRVLSAAGSAPRARRSRLARTTRGCASIRCRSPLAWTAPRRSAAEAGTLPGQRRPAGLALRSGAPPGAPLPTRTRTGNPDRSAVAERRRHPRRSHGRPDRELAVSAAGDS